MGRTGKILATILIFISLFMAKPAWACIVDISASRESVKAGETVRVDITRIKTHRSCVLPLEETKIEVMGGVIVKEYPWIPGEPDKKTIEVKFTQLGGRGHQGYQGLP